VPLNIFLLKFKANEMKNIKFLLLVTLLLSTKQIYSQAEVYIGITPKKWTN